MEQSEIESTALDRALKKRFSLLEKTRIHRFSFFSYFQSYSIDDLVYNCNNRSRNTYISLMKCCFRIAEKCFQSDEPPIRERRFIVKGLGDTERPINITKKVSHFFKLNLVSYFDLYL